MTRKPAPPPASAPASPQSIERQAMGSRPEAGPHARKLWDRSGGLSDRSPRWRWERFVWMAWLLGLARVLDRRHSTGEVLSQPRSTRVLSFAFERFLVLVEPEWWQANPPRELEEEEELRLSQLREDRQRMLAELSNGDWSLLGEILLAAAEAFFRAGFREGLDDCLRLLDLIQPLATGEDMVN